MAEKNFPDVYFDYDGVTYKVILPKVFIPGIGERTRLEIGVDQEAQAYLVKENCIGTVIEEIPREGDELTAGE